MRYLINLLVVLLCLSPAHGAVEATFPLQGYYRAGRYMPVHVRAAVENPPANPTLEIGADGAVPTRILLKSGQVDVLLPLLATESVENANWKMKATGGLFAPNFRSLGPEQRLVGFAMPIDLSIAHNLFPNKAIIPIQLDAANPLPGTPEAWETLDAIVVDSGARVEESTLETLLNAGVAIAVRTPSQPAGAFSKQMGDYWVAHRPIAGLTAGGDNSLAFLPVDSWQASWPAAFRKRIFLYAVAFSVVTLAIALLRIRFAPLLIAGISVAFTLGLWAWWQGRSAILQRSGTIQVIGNKLTQNDSWTYLASTSSTAGQEAWSPGVHPFFESRGARLAIKPALICTEDGQPLYFDFQLSAGTKIGFLSRTFIPHTQNPLQLPSKTLLELFAQKVYLGLGDRIAGELSVSETNDSGRIGEQWPTVVIEHSAGK